MHHKLELKSSKRTEITEKPMKSTSQKLRPKLALILAVACMHQSISHAAYSTDADCAVVSNAAKKSVDDAKKKVDEVAKITYTGISNNKNCVDAVVDGVNRQIPDFGGSLLTTFLNAAKKKFAETGCNYLSDVQKTITDSASNFTIPQLPPTPNISIPSITVPTDVTNILTNGANNTTTGSNPLTTLWQRLNSVSF
jgi:hypothetical protein